MLTNLKLRFRTMPNARILIKIRLDYVSKTETEKVWRDTVFKKFISVNIFDLQQHFELGIAFIVIVKMKKLRFR